MLTSIAMRWVPLLWLAAGSAYVNNLSHVFCDVKQALSGGTLNETNAATLVAALVSQMHCNGLRVPLLPSLAAPSAYSVGYNATLAAARASGLTLYASPMEGAWKAVGGQPSLYTRWVSAYAAGFAPDYLSVFNEVGDAACDAKCIAGVARAVRAALPPGAAATAQLVGPDAEHVAATLAVVRARPDAFVDSFDILSSHNAGGDGSNTWAQWRALAGAAGGRAVWSSENPTCWTLAACTAAYGSMNSSVHAGVVAVVPWNTLGDDVGLDGALSAKGADIAAHVGAAP